MALYYFTPRCYRSSSYGSGQSSGGDGGGDIARRPPTPAPIIVPAEPKLSNFEIVKEISKALPKPPKTYRAEVVEPEKTSQTEGKLEERTTFSAPELEKAAKLFRFPTIEKVPPQQPSVEPPAQTTETSPSVSPEPEALPVIEAQQLTLVVEPLSSAPRKNEENEIMLLLSLLEDDDDLLIEH